MSDATRIFGLAATVFDAVVSGVLEPSAKLTLGKSIVQECGSSRYPEARCYRRQRGSLKRFWSLCMPTSLDRVVKVGWNSPLNK